MKSADTRAGTHTKMNIFNRFSITSSLSLKELWWTDTRTGDRHWHLINISIVDRTFVDGTYRGLQIILLGLSVCIGDRKSLLGKAT